MTTPALNLRPVLITLLASAAPPAGAGPLCVAPEEAGQITPALPLVFAALTNLMCVQ